MLASLFLVIDLTEIEFHCHVKHHLVAMRSISPQFGADNIPLCTFVSLIFASNVRGFQKSRGVNILLSIFLRNYRFRRQEWGYYLCESLQIASMVRSSHVRDQLTPLICPSIWKNTTGSIRIQSMQHVFHVFWVPHDNHFLQSRHKLNFGVAV